MKFLRKVIPIMLVAMIFVLAACNDKKGSPKVNNKPKETYKLPTAVLAYRGENNKSKIYGLDEGHKTLLYEFENMIDMKYEKSNNTLVVKKYIENGDTLVHNNLVINFRDKEIVLNDFYNIVDFKLSKDGTKIAFSSYLEDKVDSITNLKVYDLEKEKYINFKTDVIISGEQYSFDNDSNLLYYGVDKAKRKNAIFSFNLETLKEKEVYDVDTGIIKSMYLLKDSLLFLKQDLNDNKLIRLNLENNEETVLSKNFEQVYGAVYNDLIYFIGNEKNSKVSLYKVQNKNIKRITYDFPSNIMLSNNITKDDKENIYILGYDEDENNRSLYQVKKDNSVNLVSDKLKVIDLYWNQ